LCLTKIMNDLKAIHNGLDVAGVVGKVVPDEDNERFESNSQLAVKITCCIMSCA